VKARPITAATAKKPQQQQAMLQMEWRPVISQSSRAKPNGRDAPDFVTL
jgi:hypothetical protein